MHTHTHTHSISLSLLYTHTQSLYGGHWALGLPWALLLFCADELRKLLIRTFHGGMVEKVLFW